MSLGNGILTGRGWCWRAVVVVFSVGAGGSVHADVVADAGRPPSAGATVTALRDGELHYRLSTGREVSRPVGQIDYLQITDWALFNLAEKQQRSGHYRQAIGGYEKLLSRLSTGADSDDGGQSALSLPDRKLLVQCRLLRVYDQEGRFDRALALYIEVIERMPAVIETLRPVKLPAAGSTFLASALEQIDVAIDRHGSDEVGVSLKKWRASWPSQKADESDSVESSGESQAVRQARQRLAGIETLIKAGQFESALEQIERLQGMMPAVVSADLYYLRAMALLGQAGEGTSPQAQRDRRRAGLALMRVVIHFPGHSLAPECLYRAGEICRQTGRTELAVGLWAELLRTYPGAAVQVERARESLRQVKEERASGG